MTTDMATTLVDRGLYLIPLAHNAKFPRHENWTVDFTNSVAPGRNHGVNCGRYKEDKYLVVIDVDVRGEVSGFDSLELFDLPTTLTVRTPSGGAHYYYYSDLPTRNFTSLLPGVDTRGVGGQAVAPGSVIDGIEYSIEVDAEIAYAPPWLLKHMTKTTPPKTAPVEALACVDVDSASKIAMAEHILKFKIREHVPEGRRNNYGYMFCCRLKDIGISGAVCLDFLDRWNEAACSPPLPRGELESIVHNAYAYGKNPVGVEAPEVAFHQYIVDGVKDPLGNLKNKFGGMIQAGKLMFFEKPQSPGDGVTLMNKDAFSQVSKNNGWRISSDDDKSVDPCTYLINNGALDVYNHTAFAPDGIVSDGGLNTWMGFPKLPKCAQDRKAHIIEEFRWHVENNICQGDDKLAHWVMSWMAHIFQKPGEKPQSMLVIKGEQGVGKSTVSNLIRNMVNGFKPSVKMASILLDMQDTILGSYNDTLKGSLFLGLEEIDWTKNRGLEGQLKSLLTSDTVRIKQKYVEARDFNIFARFLMTTNADHAVPAGCNERRFTVIECAPRYEVDLPRVAAFAQLINSARNADLVGAIREWLMAYDISGVNLHEGHKTAAFKEQVEHSLDQSQVGWLSFIGEPDNIHQDEAGIYIDPEEYRQWTGTSGHVLRKVKAFIGQHITSSVKRVDGKNKRIWRLDTTHEGIVRHTCETFNIEYRADRIRGVEDEGDDLW